MRYTISVFLALALSACQTTQTVVVETVTTQIAGDNSTRSHTISVVRDTIAQPTLETTPDKSVYPEPVSLKPGKPNPKDLEAVSKYCEAHASKVVNLKFDCRSKDEQNTCSASKLTEATHLSEYKHCLGTFGWKEY